MSVTERIIETVELDRNLDLSDDQMDQLLIAIGCTRVMHIADMLIAHYRDQGEKSILL